MPAEDSEKAGAKATTPEARYAKWRTRQMSDHAPLWVEIATDFTDSYLHDIAAAKPG